MKNEDKQKLSQLLAKLDNGSEISAQIENAQLKDPMDSLRSTLYNFFDLRLRKVEEQEMFQKAIEEKLRTKMSDDKLTVGQLIALYSMLNSESTLKTDSLLNIARAREEAIVPLTGQNVQNNQNNPNNYEILDPVKRATIEELKEYILELLAKDKNIKKELTDET